MAREHRGDIQGLRAVAVLTVIAAHTQVPFLRGGFIGVDVFYVISGYLISTLLYREVLVSGRFSLMSFWARRARRILPAATLVTVATVLASLAWLSLVDARQVVLDALWASVFAANIHFAQQGVYYFAQETGPSPLQHYWSLAVEEQFYVVWPLMLLGCLALSRIGRSRIRGGRRAHQHQTPRLPRGLLLAVLGVITLASLIWSLHATAVSPQSAYFSTFTRVWELGVGAMLALVPPRAIRAMTAWMATLLALAGAAALGVASVAYSDATPFPGHAALLPVLGTAALLVAGGGRTTTAVGRMLSTRPMRMIGDWSYSLYLWHWPVLIISEHAFGRDLTLLERLLAVVLIFGLSALTYEYVEVPFRSGRPARNLQRRRALVLYPLGLALVASTTGAAWAWTGYQGTDRGNNPPITVAAGTSVDEPSTEALVQASVEAARNQVDVPSDLDPGILDVRDSIADVGDCDYEDNVRKLCPRGDADGDRTMVLIGDSHARAWIPAFDEIAARSGWRAFYLVKPQCVAARVSIAVADDSQPFTGCADFQDWVLEQVAALDPDLVVVASSPPVNGVYDGKVRVTSVEGLIPLLRDGYDDLFTTLGQSADEVVLLRDVPKNAADPATCLTTGDPSLGTCMFTPDERSRALGDVAVQSALATGTRVVDPTPWLCWQGECPVVIGGTLSYRDADHITTEYAASLAGSLGDALGMTDADGS